MFLDRGRKLVNKVEDEEKWAWLIYFCYVSGFLVSLWDLVSLSRKEQTSRLSGDSGGVSHRE
jgi:hypothetical protein